MIIEIFAIFFAIGITIIYLGYYTKPDTEVLKIVGYLFIFILGTTLAGIGSSGIQYHSGDIINDTGTLTYVTPQYSYYTNHTLGLYTAIVSILGFISVYLQWKSGGGEND